MTPIISSSIVILFFLLSSSTILCFVLTSSNSDVVNKKDDMLVNNFRISSNNSNNFFQDNPIGTFMFSDSSSPHLSVKNSGYFNIQHSYDARMFYFFFESRGSRNDPVILWLTGGPGCGGEMALFYENGPFHIDDDLSLKWNDFGWDKISNIIYVDQPIGAGFSFSSDDRDIRNNTHEISNDLCSFLQAFFRDHPEFVKNDFYIVGQSYAGHYIPVLASQLLKGKRAYGDIHINLKGIAIGNGLTNPIHAYSSLIEFSLKNKLISKLDYNNLEKRIPGCVESTKQCQHDDNACADSFLTCYNILLHILELTDNINYYDIRKKCVGERCYDFSRIKKFLDLDSVRKDIGIENIEYEMCNENITQAFIRVDWMKNYGIFIPPLLEHGIKVFIYAGEYDLVCNWIGNYRWINEMKWSGQMQFSKVKLAPHKIGEEDVGESKTFGPLTFMKVYNAGHMVPMDQPNVSLQMLHNWMST